LTTAPRPLEPPKRTTPMWTAVTIAADPATKDSNFAFL
jgi:hypothetical protein